MRLNDEHPSGSKVKVHLTEESLYSLITPVEVNPLGQAQCQNDIILWLGVIQSQVTDGDIVTLRERESESKRDEMLLKIILINIYQLVLTCMKLTL